MWPLSGKSGYSIYKATGQRQTVAINQPQGLRVRVSFGQALSWESQIVALTDVENPLLQNKWYFLSFLTLMKYKYQAEG